MPDPADPLLAADDDARILARALLAKARHASLAVTDAETGTPGISLIAFGLDPEGMPLTLVSGLAPHMAALRSHPAAAVMVGSPGAKGDPLTHPRLMIRVTAEFVARGTPEHAALREHWLALQPKAKLYVDFADFAFARLVPVSAILNGGFGRAWRLTPEDLRQERE
ncbi:pyridoxamine 5'-phosphate oxidase family protein [Cereibacter sphaeroides]|uniref:HugZ family pyridoxamine 5'-phosphate oxidase n=1 Tax=Rhodobacterales TaxID=204455 RepID=UPI000BBF3454|nr:MULTISPECIES: pyridoxamine 5'-phosphate oxidase family protein [Paracoccaceae]MCE6949839.1 pyridoxamine 5'-phosphate oxidase family protein [Cereibacter sphaeroides]MCE6957788.1 pyridoxamine 5'-phosphate oxidase family protein [Cereibacter sphaeroides]MCE6967299.1 pyridoxamine 5'-phosphate oxidase family protein [Cereibacter sphaeroides]MCE6971549.1 pyridoxamine 5'-phosphate oxidase family protein [Cereibacter sphaeroides]